MNLDLTNLDSTIFFQNCRQKGLVVISTFVVSKEGMISQTHMNDQNADRNSGLDIYWLMLY